MISIRKTEEIAKLMHWRSEVIEHVFGQMPNDTLMAENERYYLSHVPDGRHRAYIAEVDGEEAGCGSICLTEELPSPDNPDGKCAYLMNIYVRDAFRERGVGHEIVKKLIAEAKALKCEKIYLETTAEGRRLYESLGFADLPDMMKLKD